MKKINIGLDIGIASVGWSIIDENYNIIDLGVRLFDDVADKKDGKLKNETRREARSLRRRIRRDQNRKKDLLNFFIKNNLIKSEEDFYKKINKQLKDFDVTTISELKEKMLNEKLNNSALIIVLFNYIHNRGYFYLDDVEIESDKNDKKYDIDKTNDFPSIQLNKFYKKYGFYKGCPLSRKFSHQDWKKEIIKLLEIQKKDELFIKDFMNIFDRIREYSLGPGSEKSPTKYGLYRFDENLKKTIKIGENLWEETLGKCTIYPNENRGMKGSPKAEIFNLLNDLNNVHFDKKRDKLSKEEKIRIFNELQKDLDSKKNRSVTANFISKIINFDKESISGLLEDKDIKIENYMNICRWLIANKIWNDEINILNLELLNIANNIFNELSKIKDKNKRIEKLKELYPNSSDELNKNLILKNLSQTHSLSYKAMNEYIPIGIDSSKNQMEIFSDKIIKNKQEKFSKSTKYIPKGLFDNEIISPTARRSFNQTISVINKIIKVYSNKYEIGYITIEMARDKNSNEQRKNIEKAQKRKKASIDEVLKRENKKFDELSNTQIIKLKLWEEQNHIDIYDGKEIDINDVLYNSKLDIDHILPYSISMDNSLSNKVLVKNSNNQEKNNLTPYQWLSSMGKYEEFKNRVNKIYDSKTYRKKINNLLFESELIENLDEFIQRNLVDTRYATRLVLNTLQSFFKSKNTIINVINGSVTNYCRYKLFDFPKDRDDYSHHAIDASIVCFLGMNHSISKCAKIENMLYYKKKDDFEIVNKETGEIIKLNNQFSEDNDSQYFKEQLLNNNKNVKFSRMLLSKRENIGLSKETIRGFRKNNDKLLIINKLDIINSTFKELSPYFLKDKIEDKKRNKIIIYHNNKYLYDSLFKIFNENIKDESKNPFINYMQDNYPELITIDKLIINNQSIKKLSMYGDEKKMDNIILLKEHNNKAFLEGLNPKEIRIYKDNKNKYHAIPINALVLKNNLNKIEIDENKLNFILDKKNISNKEFIVINSGAIFINKLNNEIWFSNGGGAFSQNKIEIKPIFKYEEKRYQIALSTIMTNYKIAEVDILGKIYNIREIEIN